MLDFSVKIDPTDLLTVLRGLRFRPNAIIVALDRVAERIQSNATTKQLLRGGGPVHPTRLTHRKGTLARSVSINRPSIFARNIGTNLNYAEWHEKGLRGFPVRKFLQPAFDEEAPVLRSEIFKELERSISEDRVS